MATFLLFGPARPRLESSSVHSILDALRPASLVPLVDVLVAEGGVSNCLRLIDGRGVEGLRVSFTPCEGGSSSFPADLRVLRTLRLDIGRSNALPGRGVELALPLPRMVADEEAVELVDTIRGGKS